VAQLTVRNIKPELIRCLKKKADDHGVSTEEEHRRILKDALTVPSIKVCKSFKEHLLSKPNFEEESFFEFDRNTPERASSQDPLHNS